MTHMARVRHHGMTKPGLGGHRSEQDLPVGAMLSAYEPVKAHRVLRQDTVTGSAVVLVPTAVMGKCHRAWLRFGSLLHRNTSKGLLHAAAVRVSIDRIAGAAELRAVAETTVNRPMAQMSRASRRSDEILHYFLRCWQDNVSAECDRLAHCSAADKPQRAVRVQRPVRTAS